MTETLSRRDFLLYGGAALAGVTVGELGRRYLLQADPHAVAWRPAGAETWATSVCRECPAACGVRVRSVDGVPVKLDGNPKCPVSRGRLCAKGQAAIESYFDPDRLVGPARRVGPRGENQWERIEWDAAIDLVASAVASAGGGAADEARILALATSAYGPQADAWSRFWTAAGARVAWTATSTADRLQPGLRSLTGAEGVPLFDVENATYVLSFGAPIVEEWLSPVWSQRSFGRLRRARSQSRGRLVQVEARRSLTARKADEWLAIPTDQQIYLAYGIAAVLLRESRTNRTFLDQAGGDISQFEQWVLQGYRTDATSAATGVPVVTVLRLARELSASDVPLVTVGADAPAALVEAVFALNAVIGALDRPGGVMATRVAAGVRRQDAVVALDELAAGAISPQVVALRDSSALRGGRDFSRLAQRLESVDLVVSFSPFLDEAALLADLLLPAPTSLEAWHGVLPAPAVLGEMVALSRPVVPSRLDTRDVPEVLGLVADAVGGSLAEAGPWPSSEALVGHELDRLWNVPRGTPYANDYETQWVRRLQSGGWWEPSAESRSGFGSLVMESGGWIDPLLEAGAIRRSLGRIGGLRFPPPPALPVGGTRAADRPAAMVTGVSQSTSMAAAQEGHEPFPLVLDVFTPAAISTSGSLNHPALFELLGQPGGLPWQHWAEVNPETALEFGVGHGVMARISSEHGAIEAPAIHVEGMARGVVAIAFVPSGRGQGRWARMASGDVRVLLGSAGFGNPPRIAMTRA